MQCENCGVEGSKERLFDVVSLKEKGVIKLCEKCTRQEGSPILRRPTTFQLKETEKKDSYYEKVDRNRRAHMEKSREKTSRQNVNLNEIVNRNYVDKLPKERRPRPDLVDNFHWIIMRSRRLKKITQAKLAKEISESESAIKMAEQGILPEDDHRLVRKLEGFLDIKLIKDGFSSANSRTEKFPARILSFDKEALDSLRISDLKALKEAKDHGMEFSIEDGELDEDSNR